MTRDPLEALSALIDGERVDPDELARALAHPGAIDVLRDFAALRAELLRGEPAVPPRIAERVHAAGARSARRLAAGIAAALVLVAAGLFLVDVRHDEAPQGIAAPELPPEPARELRFTEGVDWFRQ